MAVTLLKPEVCPFGIFCPPPNTCQFDNLYLLDMRIFLVRQIENHLIWPSASMTKVGAFTEKTHLQLGVRVYCKSSQKSQHRAEVLIPRSALDLVWHWRHDAILWWSTRHTKLSTGRSLVCVAFSFGMQIWTLGRSTVKLCTGFRNHSMEIEREFVGSLQMFPQAISNLPLNGNLIELLCEVMPPILYPYNTSQRTKEHFCVWQKSLTQNVGFNIFGIVLRGLGTKK